VKRNAGIQNVEIQECRNLTGMLEFGRNAGI